MKLRTLFVAMGCLVMTSAVFAQTTANLAGTWVTDNDKTAAARAAMDAPAAGGSLAPRGGGGGGSWMGSITAGGPTATPEWTVTQTAASVLIVRPLPDGTSQRFDYKLNGTSVNVNGRATLTSTSKWEAGKLVTEGTQVTATDQGEIKTTLKEVRWLDKDGAMHVETTRTINGEPTRSVVVLKKK